MNEELLAKLKKLAEEGHLSSDEVAALTGKTEPAAEEPPAGNAEETPEANPDESAQEDKNPEETSEEETTPVETEENQEPEQTSEEPVNDQSAILEGRLKDLEGTLSAMSSRLDTLQGLIDKLAVPAPENTENTQIGLPAGNQQGKTDSPSKMDLIKKQLGF